MGISAVVNTYNSERFLEACLESLKAFDEIVLCDMHSTDRTVEIARRYGCRIVYHEYTGFVEPARNYVISQAANDWVLVVDSDEVIPETLCKFLHRFTETAEMKRYAAVKMPRKNYFWGRFMRGDYPDYIIRLVRRSKSFWPNKIHVRPVIEGRIYTIPRRRKQLAVEHLANETVSQRLAKFDVYADKELLRREGEHFSTFSLFFKFTYRFLLLYLIKGGFRDGKAGVTYAFLNAFYKFTTVAKLWERQATAKKR